MNKKKEKSLYEILRESLRKRVFISYEKNGKVKEDLLLIIRIDAIGIVTFNEDQYKVNIPFEKIKDVQSKPIELLHIKHFIGKERRALDPAKAYFIGQSAADIIRILKNEEEYHLHTRSALFSKNGSFSKKKQSVHDLEIATYKWLDNKQKLTLCPIAILNQEKLIAINHDGQFVIVDKDGKDSALLCQDLIIQINEEISSLNNNSASYLAERLL